MSPKSPLAAIPLLFSLLTTAAAAAPADPAPALLSVQEARAARPQQPEPELSTLAAPPGDVGADPAVKDGLFAQAAPADPDWYIYPRVSLIYETGPGVGYHEGFTTFQGMIPLFQRPERSLFFADLRGLVSDDTLLGANAGAGYRFFSPELNRVFGVNAYYDNRDTGLTTFNQASVGFETLGCCWDFRANG